jgi:hypothetical protein
MTPTPSTRLTLGFVLAAAVVPAVTFADVERRFERSFKVSTNSTVAVDVAGASITTEAGPRGSVQFTVVQTVDTDSEAEADRALARYNISATERGNEVRLSVEQDRDSWRNNRGRPRVRISVRVTVPENVAVDLHTSGGSITVRGERTATLNAETSGGSVNVDGGRGAMNVVTSGGSIRVLRALADLNAETSGGGITVDYVGTDARSVSLDTSGGSIRIGVDPKARLDVTASTSGGRVGVEGLSITTNSTSRRQTRISGALNGGGGRLRAATSGGSVLVFAASN